MNNVVLDATILSSLMSCPRLSDFRFNHNLKSSSGKSNSLECGSIVHTFLEYYFKSIIAGEFKSTAFDKGMDAAKLYITGCPDCINPNSPCAIHKDNDFIGVHNTPMKSEKNNIGWEWALTTCEQYIEHYKNDFWIPLEVEHVKGEVIYQDDEITVLWKAKFDLIVDTNQAILPVDHKTSKQRRDSLSINNQFMGQCVLTKSRNMIINKIGFQTSLKPAEKFERVMMSYSIDRLTEWVTEIVPYYAKLLVFYAKTEIWPPNFTHCENKYGYCDFKEVCGSDRGMREEILRMNFIKSKSWDISND